MPTRFNANDLGQAFDERTVTLGRKLVLDGAVEVSLDGDAVTAVVDENARLHHASLRPVAQGRRVGFERTCSCGGGSCTHLAAAALAALDRFPALRRPEQRSFLDALTAGEIAERRRVAFSVTAGAPPDVAFVATAMVGEQTGRIEATTPRRILDSVGCSPEARAVARALGGGEEFRTAVASAALPGVLDLLLRSGSARWAATGRRLKAGPERVFDPNAPSRTPMLLSDAGPFYVDAATGEVGRARLRRPARPPPRAPVAVLPRPRRTAPVPLATESERVIVEVRVTPVLEMRRLNCPDEYGRLALVDALTLGFDYGDVRVGCDDDRQFLRVGGPGGPSFVRRDAAAEAAAFETLREDGFVQMRVADGKSAKGHRVLVFRGRDAAENWHRFLAERVPALRALGWKSLIEGDFGPRLVETVGLVDVHVADAEPGRFSLEFGIDIGGERLKLLPILSHLLERGGMEAALVIGDDLITSLPDGRVVKLPAERIGRLLGVMGDLIAAAGTAGADTLELPEAEAPTVLELEDLLSTRWQDASAIEAAVARFRGAEAIAPVEIPASFRATLRPYQLQGVAWLQHLRAHGLGGFLADDMGLGKTAQTIAHILIEHEAGRMRRPALVVVPTSLVANWISELAKFAPDLGVVVLHGLDRHQRRQNLDGAAVVITTYTVLARDMEEMRPLPWHMVVLDEAQAIKSPDAKATRAVCQLETGHRLCLSGTPIENNLEELWSQFAFLMPGLLGERRVFARRFRTPIEKRGDEQRRLQLVRRIRPFILRRTKSEVATELPPKHTILRRITLGAEQRELYETIRVTLYEKVREQVAERSLAQSRIVVLDALLKLRQACCDPRLVRLPSARQVQASSKLDDLLEMIGEMLPEGRRILLFSQFTSMLDLIKPRLDAAGIRYVELRGDTRDRAEPVRAFEAGEVALFLISLKAGGRGLNLVSADTVIHYDPWWNPAAEEQASDRAHRIGQTKSVFVYKLIAADTVEERILELQQRKAELASIAFAEHADLAGLEMDDIAFLFGPDRARNAA
jgi:superfamily II DNA or RNA helicase